MNTFIVEMPLHCFSGKPVIAAGCEDGSLQLFTWDDKSLPPKWNRAVIIQEHNSQVIIAFLQVL